VTAGTGHRFTARVDMRIPSVSVYLPPGDKGFPWHRGWEAWLAGQDTQHAYLVREQITNWQLLMVQRTTPNSLAKHADWSWDYKHAAILLSALIVWNPAVQDEPLGWMRRPGSPRVRRAPRREDAKPGVNLERCRHGGYMVHPCGVDPYCHVSEKSGRRAWLDSPEGAEHQHVRAAMDAAVRHYVWAPRFGVADPS
jgi:hypothetical protein